MQMWTQIVGKVRLARAPMSNHWWHIALYVTARGLTTSPMPDGNRAFQIDFDFIEHRLIIATSDGQREEMPLASRPLLDFYAEFFARLRVARDRHQDLAGAGGAAGGRPVHRGPRAFGV